MSTRWKERGLDFRQLVALRSSTPCLIRLAAALPAADGCKFAKEITGFLAFGDCIRSTVNGEVKFFPVIDDQQCSSSEAFFL